MKIEYYREYSHHLNRQMEYKVFGHAGKPCIAFPTQDHRFYEYEDQGMIEAIKGYIEEGRLQVFCVDGIDGESWSALWKIPRDRMLAQESYYNYVIEELVPRIYEINTYGNGGGVASGILTFGCSMGAYQAMNFFLRRPDIFDGVLALSGLFHSGFFVKDYADDLTFLNSPIDTLRCMPRDHHYVELYRRAKIVVCVGQGAWEYSCVLDTRALDFEFSRLGVPTWFDYWSNEYVHDWSSWKVQAPHFLYHILD